MSCCCLKLQRACKPRPGLGQAWPCQGAAAAAAAAVAAALADAHVHAVSSIRVVRQDARWVSGIVVRK